MDSRARKTFNTLIIVVLLLATLFSYGHTYFLTETAAESLTTDLHHDETPNSHEKEHHSVVSAIDTSSAWFGKNNALTLTNSMEPPHARLSEPVPRPQQELIVPKPKNIALSRLPLDEKTSLLI